MVGYFSVGKEHGVGLGKSEYAKEDISLLYYHAREKIRVNYHVNYYVNYYVNSIFLRKIDV